MDTPRPGATSAEPMRAILVGAGRMGLTHLALFNLLTNFGVRWVVVEPSPAMRWGLRTSLPRGIVESYESAIPMKRGAFEFAVVTTPTTAHSRAYQQLAGIARKIFVEKPLAVSNPSSNTLCGYVMLHHPHHARFKSEVALDTTGTLRIGLRANTVLGRNTGWRGRTAMGGGVVNEFGSHALSILVDLVGPVAAIAVSAEEIVHSIDAPDRATLTGKSARGTGFEVTLDWTDAGSRKPSYGVRFERADGSAIEHDFSEYRGSAGTTSIANVESRLGSYLRGIEFTRQARFFLDHETFDEALAVAVEVDRVLGAVRDRAR
jgi:predicted dehydrogenase